MTDTTLTQPKVMTSSKRGPRFDVKRQPGFWMVAAFCLAMLYGPHAVCLFPPAEKVRSKMSTTPTIKTTPPRKMTYWEFNQAKVRLRRRLEDSVEEIPLENGAEHRFVVAMIDLLYCLNHRDSGAEATIDGIRKLTRKGRLRDIFSCTRSEYTEHGLVVRVESPGRDHTGMMIAMARWRMTA